MRFTLGLVLVVIVLGLRLLLLVQLDELLLGKDLTIEHVLLLAVRKCWIVV